MLELRIAFEILNWFDTDAVTWFWFEHCSDYVLNHSLELRLISHVVFLNILK